MKTEIELPPSIEVKNIKIDQGKNKITIEHRVLSGQSQATVGYLTCTGNGGMKSQAVLYLSGNTGRYQAKNTTSEATLKFDLPPEKFEELESDLLVDGMPVPTPVEEE
jgi:hypothetical protein